MRIYNQLGWLDTSDEGGARQTVQDHPQEWSLQPWIRPGGAANVNVGHDWPAQSAAVRIELARQIKGWDMPGETAAALGITDPGVADEIIRGYVIGSQHPGVTT